MQEHISTESAGVDEKLIQPSKFVPLSGPTRLHKPKLRAGSIAVVVGLIISAVIAWYIVTGKSVYFEIVPETARLDISGGIKLKLADRYLLRKGSYQVQLTATGYHPLFQELQITNERSQEYPLQMKRLPGHLRVNTEPPTNAEVLINDTAHGYTPATISSMEPGNYIVRISSERFFDYETEIEIEGLDKEQALTAELQPAWANVRLTSSPVAADIFLDDQLIGTTPFSAEVLQGEHDLRVKLPGYKLWRKQIRVVAGEDQAIEDIKLESADAVVQIITIPEKANITVNGEYIGQSPLEAALSPNSVAVVNAFKPGFSRASRNLRPVSGDNSTLRIELMPEMASVRILANPKDARVYIDGILSGVADQTLELTTTPHTIEIRKDGYVDYKTGITPRPGIAQHINVELKTLQQAKLELIKPEMKTAAGQTIKMYEPVSVIMGASRREPGRRANETLRNVQFSRAFYLSETEVTNAEFRKFDPKHNSGEVQGNALNGDRQPVVNITWEQAALYCNWLSKQDSLTAFYSVTDNKVSGFNPQADGYRLPTEAEWEWAAREMAGNQLRFPWGDSMPPKDKSGNYADISAAPIIGKIVRDYNDKYIATAPVASFTPNSKGLHDLGGNVAEWVHDYYDISASSEDNLVDPVGPVTGDHHVIKGSSWAHGTITELRLSFRDYGSEKRSDVGFRIARYTQ